jgi:hypothetical protein
MKMHSIQFVSVMMAIQMKLMKVTRKMKNMPVQEFQHDMESQLIQVSRMKTRLIQFVAMMMVIQMKLMKMRSNLKNMTIQGFQHDMESQLIQV